MPSFTFFSGLLAVLVLRGLRTGLRRLRQRLLWFSQLRKVWLRLLLWFLMVQVRRGPSPEQVVAEVAPTPVVAAEVNLFSLRVLLKTLLLPRWQLLRLS